MTSTNRMNDRDAIPLPGRGPGHGAAHDEGHQHHARRDAQDWWVSLFRGGWLIIFGGFALFAPDHYLPSIAAFLATAIFVSGGVLLTNGFMMRSPLPIVQGVLSLVAAAIVAFFPRDAWLFKIVTVSVWAISLGVVDLMMTTRHQALRGRSFLAAAGLVGILGGLLGFFAPRFPGVLPVGLFGLLAVLAGGSLIAYGMRRRRRKGRTSAVASANADEERRHDRNPLHAH